MLKSKKITVEVPTEEELNLISDEEHEARFEALENVASFEELLGLLAEYGFNVTEADEENEGPGPNDTIH